MLTIEEIESFHGNGFLIMRGLIRGRELEMLRRAADSVVEEGIARAGAGHLYYRYPDGREVYRRSEQMWSRDPIFQAVTVNPELLENVGQCVGQAFFPWNDSLVVKLPREGAPVAWHQDPPYGDDDRLATYPVPNFTTDIYLDHSDFDNGCVYALPGHHLQGHIDLKTHSEEFLFDRATPLEMEPGDVLFHALSVPHGSRGSLGDRLRRTFYVHYLADEVYRDAYTQYAWAAEKPGWNEERRRQCEEMIQARGGLGFEAPGQSVRFNEKGFEFCGTPVSSPRCWQVQ